MKITFLGTGAADWNLQLHKEWNGFRRNSSVLIDDTLLIDPGPDVPDALMTFGKNADEIRYVLNTHRHRDHFDETTLSQLGNAVLYTMSADEVISLGKYTVKALAANHKTCPSGCTHFLISDGEKSLFYGLDGAWLTYEEVASIQENGVDLAVLDATVGEVKGDYRIFEHNNLNMVREIKATLAPYIKRFVISHMARTLHTSHAELCECMARDGIEVACDGLELTV